MEVASSDAKRRLSPATRHLNPGARQSVVQYAESIVQPAAIGVLMIRLLPVPQKLEVHGWPEPTLPKFPA
jgi:hypothetical protein